MWRMALVGVACQVISTLGWRGLSGWRAASAGVLEKVDEGLLELVGVGQEYERGAGVDADFEAGFKGGYLGEKLGDRDGDERGRG